MTGFVLIAIICVTFIDYAFLNIINDRWQTDAEKASFLANFEATVVIFSFLFQTIITGWFKVNYGHKTSLLINPSLAIIYNSESIELIKENIELGTTDGNAYAIGTIFSEHECDIITTTAREDSTLFAPPLNNIFDILSNYPQLIKQFITRVSQQYSDTQLST
jgi:hypothetical protein